MPAAGRSGLSGPDVVVDRDLDHGLRVDPNPRLRVDLVDADLDLSERRLDRGDAAPAGDGGRASSDESAPVDQHLLTAARQTVLAPDDDCERSLQENVVL